MNRQPLRASVSPLRAVYLTRLTCRCLVLAAAILLYFHAPKSFDIIENGAFFSSLSIFHLLWLVWMMDMLQQLIPSRKGIALGSQKNFGAWFRPGREPAHSPALKAHIRSVNRSAALVFLLWTAVVCTIGLLYRRGVLSASLVLLISVFFYVCDLICVLIWCPFRLMLGNRCCTTCRIFNWDHLMMFAPLGFIPGFFTRSLAVLAAVIWVIWELSVLLHPERFWAGSNAALTCAACTDKLCTQYCGKRR